MHGEHVSCFEANKLKAFEEFEKRTLEAALKEAHTFRCMSQGSFRAKIVQHLGISGKKEPALVLDARSLLILVSTGLNRSI